MASALAPEAGFLVAAERGGRIEAVVRVRPHDTGAKPLDHPEDARALLRPDSGGEPVRGVVRLLDGLLRRAEREHREDGAEDLLLCDAVALRDVREERRHEPVAAIGELAYGLVDLGALVLPARHELANLLELRLRVDRTDVGVLVQRVADAESRKPALALLEEGLVDRHLHQPEDAHDAGEYHVE